jgi:hypothetical protein
MYAKQLSAVANRLPLHTATSASPTTAHPANQPRAVLGVVSMQLQMINQQ